MTITWDIIRTAEAVLTAILVKCLTNGYLDAI